MSLGDFRGAWCFFFKWLRVEGICSAGSGFGVWSLGVGFRLWGSGVLRGILGRSLWDFGGCGFLWVGRVWRLASEGWDKIRTELRQGLQVRGLCYVL